MKTIAERDAGLAVVKHHATDEAVAGRLLEFAQSAKIIPVHRRGRLDFHTGDGAGSLFHHDIRFSAVLVPEMEKLDGCVLPARLSSQFLKRKRFQKVPQQSPVRRQGLGVSAEQSRGEGRYRRDATSDS